MEGIPTPYAQLGGRDAVIALAERFYDEMEAEPALLALHKLDAGGKADRPTREKFALFFIGWLGGPQDYMAQHGHPRLRQRHAHVPVDQAMRDAWLRAMTRALDARGVTGDVRRFLDAKLGDLATFLKNRPG